MMAAAALMLLLVNVCMTLTSCSSDDDEVKVTTNNYSISFDGVSFHSTSSEYTLEMWIGTITQAYKQALNASADNFTLTGNSEQCDLQVQTACKQAESALSAIAGGTATVVVTNNTTGKTVYTYQVQDNLKITLVSSVFTPSSKMLQSNQIELGSGALVLSVNNPGLELTENYITVDKEFKSGAYLPGWPRDLNADGEPEVKVGTTFKNEDGNWVVNYDVLLPYAMQEIKLHLTFGCKGEVVGSQDVESNNPIQFTYDGCTDGYLYVGKTYPMKVSYYHNEKEFDYNSIYGAGITYMNPNHKDEFEVDLDDDDMPYVKIYDTFTFTDGEKAAGFAVICPSIMISGEGSYFQAVPVKAQ